MPGLYKCRQASYRNELLSHYFELRRDMRWFVLAGSANCLLKVLKGVEVLKLLKNVLIIAGTHSISAITNKYYTWP